MELLYIAFTLLCSVSLINGWIGDSSNGANCLVHKKEFVSIEQCFARLVDNKDVLFTIDGQRDVVHCTGVQGPWALRNECRIVVDDEVIQVIFGPTDRKEE